MDRKLHRKLGDKPELELDPEFTCNQEGLSLALELLQRHYATDGSWSLPTQLPDVGVGSAAALEQLAPGVLGQAAKLGSEIAFAHMDPPTPWITWATSLWNASSNQNLLHPATAPVARDCEKLVIDWLAPFFCMDGGHMTPGSTLANLTALWAARECAAIDSVVAAQSAHLSIRKAAHLLGLRYEAVATDSAGALLVEALPHDLSRSALVLTAGTTSTGVVDPLDLAGRAAWTHVDAAWAGPLRLTRYANRLDGIDKADSVAVSAHKWLFQPKESALIFFRDTQTAHAAVSFEGAYLAVPNLGLQGSHGAMAVPLLATLLAWGRDGLAARIEQGMLLAEQLASYIASDPRLILLDAPQTGVVVWRPADQAIFDAVAQRLPSGAASTTTLLGERWLRHVAANPNADMILLIEAIRQALSDAHAATQA